MYRQEYYLLDCSNSNSEQLVNCFQEHYMVTPPQNGKNLKYQPKKRRGETKNNYDKRRTHIQKLENQIKNIKNTLSKDDQEYKDKLQVSVIDYANHILGLGHPIWDVFIHFKIDIGPLYRHMEMWKILEKAEIFSKANRTNYRLNS